MNIEPTQKKKPKPNTCYVLVEKGVLHFTMWDFPDGKEKVLLFSPSHDVATRLAKHLRQKDVFDVTVKTLASCRLAAIDEDCSRLVRVENVAEDGTLQFGYIDLPDREAHRLEEDDESDDED